MDWLIILLVTPGLIGFVGVGMKRGILGPKAEWPVNETPHVGGYRDDARPSPTPAPGSGFTGFRKFYFVTLGWHPLLAGLSVGLAGWPLGIPVPAAFGTGYLGAVIAYTFAGMVAAIAYDTIVKTIRRMVGAAGNIAGSE